MYAYLHGDGLPGDHPGGGALGDAVTMPPRLYEGQLVSGQAYHLYQPVIHPLLTKLPVPGPGARAVARDVREHDTVHLELPQLPRDVPPVTLYRDVLGQGLPLPQDEVFAPGLGVEHLVPDNN